MNTMEIIEKIHRDWKNAVQKDKKIADVCYLIRKLVDEGVLKVNPDEAEDYITFEEDDEAIAVFTYSITNTVKQKIQEVLDDSPFSAAEIRIETRKEQTENNDISSGEESLRKLGFRITSEDGWKYAKLELAKFQKATAYLSFHRR